VSQLNFSNPKRPDLKPIEQYVHAAIIILFTNSTVPLQLEFKLVQFFVFSVPFCYYCVVTKSWDSSVGIVSRLKAVQRGIWFLVRDMKFLCSPKSPCRFCGPLKPSSYSTYHKDIQICLIALNYSEAFRTNLTTNSDFCFCNRVVLYHRSGECLLRGMYSVHIKHTFSNAKCWE
jgi:hypothetical protein